MRRALLITSLLLLGTLGMLAQLSSGRHADDASAPRNLSGTVFDKGDKPVPNAVVYLKSERNFSVITFITGDDGGFRFNNLSPSVDYEVRAESAGRKSGVKTLSSFDSRKQAHINLKLDK